MSLTAEVLKGFVGSLLAGRYDEPLPTPGIHLEWWGMACSEHKLVSIAAPRYHAKSTAITHAYTLASLLFRESSYCVIVSDTESQAIEFLQELKKELTTNDELIELFDIAGLSKDSETDIIVDFKTKKAGKVEQFRVRAKGVGQRIRGIKWNQKRPNLILIDDIENEENAATKEQRDKLKRWINGTLIPIMAKRGKLRAVGTIIHTDSWLNGTMPDEKSPLTVLEPLKTWSRRLTKGWYSAKYRGHPAIGDYSQFLWPEHRSEEFFKAEYERLEADGQADVYSAEHLNNPIDETHAYFKKRDFVDIPAEARKNLASGELKLNYYSSVDFAISKAERADYTVIGTAGVDEAGQLYLVDVRRDRFGPDESVIQIFSVEHIYNPEMFFVEKGTLAHALGAMLNKEMEKRRSFPNLSPVSATGDKRTKARGIQKVMRAGGLYVDKQAEWYPAFEDELLRFDRGRHDDQVDMLALFGLKLDELIDAPTAAEIEEEEWEEAYGDALLVGKNKTTGY